jgi:hypothetical protein
MPDVKVNAIPPANVWRALPPGTAQKLHAYCKLHGDNPADALADIVDEFFDREAGAIHDPTLIELADAVGGVS